MANFIKHGPCGNCGSSDARAIYSDGSSKCYSCGSWSSGKNKEKLVRKEKSLTLEQIFKLPVAGLDSRKISQEICEMYGIRTAYSETDLSPESYYFPIYNNSGTLSGYQASYRASEGFERRRVGHTKDCLPFGSHVAGNKGRMVVVTEGAEDCLSVKEIFNSQGKNWKVVATLGTEGWKKNLEYFKAFQTVIIAFDQDKPGITASEEFALALSGLGVKVRIMTWDPRYKDPNDILVKSTPHMFMVAMENSRFFKPSGFITGEDVWERIENYTKPEQIAYPEEWPLLRHKLEGLREGEISLWCGGTGCGKTSYIRRLKQHVLKSSDWKIGEVELEESPEKTWRGLMQFAAGKKMYQMTPEEKREVWLKTYGTERIITLDHRSQHNNGSIIDKFNYLHYSMGCKVIFLDHITLAVSEFGDGVGLADQDRMMNSFLSFVETTKCHLVLISHLRKTSTMGVSFESGAIPREDDLKGSGSLKQIAFDIIGVARNKHHPDEEKRNVSQIHILKCRETGKTGPADCLVWDDDNVTLAPTKLKVEIFKEEQGMEEY